jgi:phosphoglycerate dehydrogenase-like enzyme
MILVAIPEPLRSRILPSSLLDELRALAPVAIAPTPDDLLAGDTRELLAQVQVLVTGWGSDLVDAEVLAAAPRLRAVVHTAGSVRPVVKREVYARGVVVSSQAWANALPVAEYTLAMILLSAKGVLRARDRYWAVRGHVDVHEVLEGLGTYRTQVGIVGASTIGRRVIELIAPFDLTVALYDPTLRADDAAALGATRMSLDELMRTSRVVSLHAPWLPSTEGMIGAAELAALPDGATFINTARGALVDEPALVRELQSGRIDAVLDVTWPEPPSSDSPLWTLPNVVLTPHVAGSAGNELERMGASAVREVARVVRGEPLHHAVDADAYDRLA